MKSKQIKVRITIWSINSSHGLLSKKNKNMLEQQQKSSTIKCLKISEKVKENRGNHPMGDLWCWRVRLSTYKKQNRGKCEEKNNTIPKPNATVNMFVFLFFFTYCFPPKNYNTLAV